MTSVISQAPASQLNLALISLNQTALDFSGNAERILRALQEAYDNGSDLAICGELSITSYGLEDAFLFPSRIEEAWQSFKNLLDRAPKNMSYVVGLPVYKERKLYNCAALVSDGKLVALKAKSVMAKNGLYYEPRWFEPWAPGTGSTLETEWGPIPFGDVRATVKGWQIAVEICEEAWIEKPFLKSDPDQALNLVINISASHFALSEVGLDKHAQRIKLVEARAKALGAYYAYVNLNGLDAGRAIYDGDCLLASSHGLLLNAPRLHWRDYQLTRICIPKDSSTAKPISTGKASPPPFEDFLHAQTLALWDYLRKTKAQGYTVSLSGGCDSSVCASLVALMLQKAFSELGFENTRSALNKNWQDPNEARHDILQCVYLASENSGQTTENMARTLSFELGASFQSLSVQSVISDYTQIAEKVAQRKLQWQSDDLTLQNIQARARAPMIWMLANLKKHVLIATSNRSEACMGYMTMDGDTAGGLAPLAGVSKDFLRKWLLYASSQDIPKPYQAIACLKDIAGLAPTAELKPVEQEQRDEDELMPYDVLARIESLFLHLKLGPDEILNQLANEFSPKHNTAQLKEWVDKYHHFFKINQWKRARLPHSFHIMEASCDPSAFFRFPIISC